MKLADYLQTERGRIAAVAKVAGLAPAYMWQIANGLRPAPPIHCAAIEAATDRDVRRWDLRPEDWWRIWPELVGAAGAPACPADSLGHAKVLAGGAPTAGQVLEPHLDPQLAGRAPLVHDHGDAPSAGAAHVDHLAGARQRGVGGQVLGGAPAPGQEAPLLVGHTQVHLDAGLQGVAGGADVVVGHDSKPTHFVSPEPAPHPVASGRRTVERDEQTCDPSPAALGVVPANGNGIRARQDAMAACLQRALRASSKPRAGGRDRSTRNRERG